MAYNYSIIISHYDMPRLLKRLLTTIPVREDAQVIVVDDCSPANALDEIEVLKPQFPRVEWYSTGTNGGGGKARNVGLTHAKGKYVTFADSDDYFNLCFDEMLEKYKDASDDIIYFSVNSVDTETYRMSNRGLFMNTNVDRFLTTGDAASIKLRSTGPYAKFIRRGLLTEHDIKFQESRVYNDMKFSLYSDYYSKNISADKHAIYCLTYRENSVSSVSNADPEKELVKVEVMAEYYNFHKQHNLPIDVTGMITPTYYNLKKLGRDDYVDQMFKIWKNECGFTDFELKKIILKHRVRCAISPIYRTLKSLFK